MPTKTTKGDHGTPDRGSQGRGPQKATHGSTTVGVEEPNPEEHTGERRAEQGADTARPQPAGDEDRNP